MNEALIALAALAGLATPGVAGQPPIRLTAEEVGDGVRLTVIGDAATPVEASYSLEVRSNAAAGNNASVQRGTARLVPGETKQLITLTLGNVRKAGWSATLLVEPSQGAAYSQNKRSE